MKAICERYRTRVVALAASIALMATAAAQQSDGRRAVRLSSVDGQVELSQGGTQITDHALANLPVFEGTTLTTADDGRVELQFDDGSIVRIAPDSSLQLAKVSSDGETSVVLESGMGYFEFGGSSGQSQMQVRFGDSVVTPNGFTVLRIRLDQPPGEVAVFSGNASLNEGNGAAQVELNGGESVTLNANDPARYTLSENIVPDSWDQWNSDRDAALSAAQGDQNQNPALADQPDSGNPAWADLNQNGTWYDTPDQGYVWSPYEASDPGWDPYGTGYWVDQPVSGYMWVSGEPWGYLPYQCGAWNYYGGFGWGWAPGMCQPWWRYGSGWGYNIGNAPVWYRRPVRPNPPRWHGAGPRTLLPTNGGKPPIGIRPIIAVNRRETPPGGVALPPRVGNDPVILGGTVARPVRPVAPRLRPNPPTITQRQEPRIPATPVGSARGRSIYTPPPQNTFRGAQTWPTARPGYNPTAPAYPRSGEPRVMPSPVYRPPVNPGGARPAPAPRYSAPAPRMAPAPRAAPAPRYSPPPAPRAAPAPRPGPPAHR